MELDLGVLIADPAALPEAAVAARRVAHAGGSALIFLMDDAVRIAGESGVAALLDEGIEVVLCASDAERSGIEATCAGPRFGSQWDHACMIRDAREIVALTGAAATRVRLPLPTGAARARRRVAVRLTRTAWESKTAQALRSAVAYAAADLDVRVWVEPTAQALLAPDGLAPARLGELSLRALSTLRALGCPVSPTHPTHEPVDVEVAW